MKLDEWICKWRPEMEIEGRREMEDGTIQYAYKLKVRNRRTVLYGDFGILPGGSFDLDVLLLNLALALSLFTEEMPISEFAEHTGLSLSDKNLVTEYRKMMLYIERLVEGLGDDAADDLSEVRW